jgi:hypothetical protein
VPWRAFVELAAGRVQDRATARDSSSRRLSLDGRYDGHWSAGGPRMVLSGRIDVSDRSGERAHDIGTLREAYVGWQPTTTTAVQAGRINVRQGVAYGYNPTDFFKGDALRAVTSPDPAVLRENRQGTVALQAQWLWTGGSISALLSPDLGDKPSADAYSLDLGATNARTRWMLALGQRLNDWLDPQWLVTGGPGQPVRWGLNLAVPLGDAIVGFVEVAGGRSDTVVSAALDAGAPRRSGTRGAAGLTYTTGFDLSLTLEAEINDMGLSRSDWNALDAMQQAAVLVWADRQQDLPSRHAVFAHALWKNLAGSGLDVAGYLRREGATGSRDQWLEVRYRWHDTDLALQWQQYAGDRSSLFGRIPSRRTIELQVRTYF